LRLFQDQQTLSQRVYDSFYNPFVPLSLLSIRSDCIDNYVCEVELFDVRYRIGQKRYMRVVGKFVAI
jgi:hypothetical protein